MKRILLTGLAIVVSHSLVAMTHAQQKSNIHYSSYGYSYQDATPQTPVPSASPSDAQVPEPPQPSIDEPSLLTPSEYNSPPVQDDVVVDGSPFVMDNCDGCATDDCGGCATGNCGGCATGNCGGCAPTAGCGGCGNCSKCCIGSVLHSGDCNIVVGVRTLIFERDYEDDISLGYNASGDWLFSTDSQHDWLGGLEATISNRGCTGRGWEFGYWGLIPEASCVGFSGAPLYSNLYGLANIDLEGVSVYDAMNNATNWCLRRETEIHNLEFNLLRNGGSTCGLFGDSMNLEWLGGIRWMSFQEELGISATGPNPPEECYYDLLAQNHLLGLQLGARLERCLCKCWTITLGSKFGVYNNDTYTRHSIQDGLGNTATMNGGNTNYWLTSRKKDVSTLGELELGLNYQFNACTRFNLGYRAIGISGVALAGDQIPRYYTDVQDTQRVKSNGNLLLHGLTCGIERSF